MKRNIFVIVCFAFMLALTPQKVSANDITFLIENHLLPDRNGNSLGIESKVERNLGLLFDRMRRASILGEAPNYEGINITEEGKDGADFYCENFMIALKRDTFTVTPWRDADGFQIRGITARVLPRSEKEYTGPTDIEFVVCIDPNGVIIGVGRSDETWALRTTGTFRDETDMERQQTIKKFVENFRQYYELKDIESLRKIYSEDALIITGRVIKEKKGVESPRIRSKIIYDKKDVKTYLYNLENKTFKNNRYINVKFDDIEIKRCGTPGKTNFYGVTLRQTWDSSTYNDEGYLFLLWEFDETGVNPPLVHVRAWQPLKVDGKDLKKSERISLNNCEF